MSLVAAKNGVPADRAYEYGGILPFLGAIAGFVAKAIPVVSSIFSGISQVRAAVTPPPPAPVLAASDAGDDIGAWLDSLSDDELVQLAIDEGLIDPALLEEEPLPQMVSQGFSFTSPAIRTSAVYTTQLTPRAASGGFGRELM